MEKFRKLLLILFILAVCSLTMLGQAKLVTEALPNSEIDRLYEFYKNREILNLITTHGEIEAFVTIEVNEVGKPKSIIIKGVTENKLAMISHLSNTLNIKVKQGYAPVKNYISTHESYFIYLETYVNSLSVINNRMKYEMAFSKYEMNFHLIFGLDIKHLSKEELQNLIYNNNKGASYYWQIELKDTSRVTGLDSSEFIF